MPTRTIRVLSKNTDRVRWPGRQGKLAHECPSVCQGRLNGVGSIGRLATGGFSQWAFKLVSLLFPISPRMSNLGRKPFVILVASFFLSSCMNEEAPFYGAGHFDGGGDSSALIAGLDAGVLADHGTLDLLAGDLAPLNDAAGIHHDGPAVDVLTNQDAFLNPKTCHLNGQGCCGFFTKPTGNAQFVTTIDLSKVALAQIPGTCGKHYDSSLPKEQRRVELPLDPAAYPAKIILPAIKGADPACTKTCDIAGLPQVPKTAFGIGMEIPASPLNSLLSNGRVLAIHVPEPWYLVSGGCGEACSTPCMNGYQEFGGPRSCITMAYGNFGFATDDPLAPSVEATLEVFDVSPASRFDFFPASLSKWFCCAYKSP